MGTGGGDGTEVISILGHGLVAGADGAASGSVDIDVVAGVVSEVRGRRVIWTYLEENL